MSENSTELTSKKYLLISVVIGGFFVFNLVRLVFLNIQKQQTIQARKTEVALLEDQVAELQNRASYYSTDEYLEREARDRLQLVKPNETLVIIPDSAKTQIQNSNPKTTTGTITEQNMLKLWASLLFGGDELKRFVFDF